MEIRENSISCYRFTSHRHFNKERPTYLLALDRKLLGQFTETNFQSDLSATGKYTGKAEIHNIRVFTHVTNVFVSDFWPLTRRII